MKKSKDLEEIRRKIHVLRDILSYYREESRNKILAEVLEEFLGIMESSENGIPGNISLDELQEIVNFIKANKSKFDNLSVPNISGLAEALVEKVNANAEGLTPEHITKWKEKLGVGELPSNIATIDEGNKQGNTYTKEKVDELLSGSAGGGNGKNLANADLQIPAGTVRTLDVTGAKFQIKGKANANNDASFNRRPVENANGEQRYVEASALIKIDALNAMQTMSDAEKDAYRLAMRKSNENYSLGAPRVDFFLPFIVKKEDKLQYISIKGLNLFLPPNSSVYLINHSTNEEHFIDHVSTSPQDPTTLVFTFNFKDLPLGEYRLKIVSNGLNNLDKTTFKLVESLIGSPIPNLTWQTQSKTGWTQNPETYARESVVKWKVGTNYDEFGGSGLNTNISVFGAITNEPLIDKDLMKKNFILKLKSTISGAGFSGVSGYQGGFMFGLTKNNVLDVDKAIDFGLNSQNQSGGMILPGSKTINSDTERIFEVTYVKIDNILNIIFQRGTQVVVTSVTLGIDVEQLYLFSSFRGCSVLKSYPQYSKDVVITNEIEYIQVFNQH